MLKTVVSAPIEQVAALLAKELKPGRKVISAVRFANGHMQEICEGDEDKTEAVAEPVTAAASVAAPTRGCPVPDFDSAEIKARGVLATFLSPEQLDDFARHNRFISRGADTDHGYMITSRQAADGMATYHRTLFDLDEGRPLCVHDWSVPAAEEMLSLHLLLSLPGWESYLRHEEHDVELSPELWH